VVVVSILLLQLWISHHSETRRRGAGFMNANSFMYSTIASNIQEQASKSIWNP
jgi:hypothetical protein